MEAQSTDQGSHLNCEAGALSPKSQTARELLTPGGINYWELWHLYTKPSIIQLLTASTQDTLSKQQARKKPQKQSSTDWSPTGTPKYTTLPTGGRGGEPPLFPLECRHKLLLIRSQHTPLNQPLLQGQKPKAKRYTSLKAGKGDLNQSTLEKNKRTEKYSTNERTKEKLTTPNKEEISNLSEREFGMMVVKMFQRLENRMEKTQETIDTVAKDIEEIKN